ncbi:hypothetical protein [Sulfurimonas sp.]|uniref:hypothetical protein n=1 Tax=Sulfurimonas sp. TaxID=2022749 RepID=UPI0025D5F8BA|nr:hypothetical protein [Sulfurimonas sp.]MBT5934485.1 hypothetical protein [Sulfurimonas sp.]
MIKKTILLVSALLMSASASSCWKSEELASFAQDEFDEKARFSIKDVVTCRPIAHAKLSLGKMTFEADEQGIVTLPLPPENMDRELPVRLQKSGYITANENVMVVFGSYWNNLFLMSKALPIGSARFALSWDKKPSDLDIHLKSDNYHISYRTTKSIANRVKLDRDAMKGYGPETITVDKLDKNDTYKVLVNRYSKSGNIDNKTQVRVYINNKLDRIVRLKNTTATCVQVATIHNNKVKYKLKELSNSECR